MAESIYIHHIKSLHIDYIIISETVPLRSSIFEWHLSSLHGWEYAWSSASSGSGSFIVNTCTGGGLLLLLLSPGVRPVSATGSSLRSSLRLQIHRNNRWHYVKVSMWILKKLYVYIHIDGLVQERSNSSAFTALAMELHLSCTNPSIYIQDMTL